MKEISELTACVVDHGLFLPVAQKLAEQYKRVFYFSPWDTAAPKIADGIIGRGFDNLTRIEDPWEIKKECDLFVFPDVGFRGLQKELIEQEYPVWGHHGGDILEVNRGVFLNLIEDMKLETPVYEIVSGLSALRIYLRDKTDKWIKVSKWRGDWETFHWRSWREDESELDKYAFKFGPAKELIRFYVFDPIDTDIEDGVDTYFCGRFPKTVLHGMECKDKSYIAAVQPLAEISEQVTGVMEPFARALAEFGYSGFFTCEVRIKGEKSFFIDPTCRAASPGSQTMMELFSNIGEIVWAGANGECVEPELTSTDSTDEKTPHKYGAQVLLNVHREDDEWIVLEIPDELRRWTKFGFAAEIDGRICEPPHALKTMAGWLCATGHTLESTIDKLKSYAELLPEGVECDVTTLAKLLEEAKAAKKEGIDLAPTVPDPAIVV